MTMPQSHFELRRSHFEAEMERSLAERRPRRRWRLPALAAAGAVLAAGGAVAAPALLDSQPAGRGSSLSIQLGVQMVTAMPHPARAGRVLPVPTVTLPPGAGDPVDARRPRARRGLVQAYPDRTVGAVGARVLWPAPASGPARGISYAPIFEGVYDYGGDRYSVTVTRPLGAARRRTLTLGSAPRTVTDGSGVRRTTYFLPGIDVTQFATEDVVVSVRRARALPPPEQGLTECRPGRLCSVDRSGLDRSAGRRAAQADLIRHLRFLVGR